MRVVAERGRRGSRWWHGARAGLLAVLLVGLCAVLASSGADAKSRANTQRKAPAVSLVCTIATQVTFRPRLNFNTVSASISAHLTNCLSPDGSARDITSGILFGSRGSARGCWPLPLYLDASGTKFYWSNEEASSVAGGVSTDVTTGQLGFFGRVLDGPLAGTIATGVPVIVAQNGVCGLGGVQSFILSLAAITFTHG